MLSPDSVSQLVNDRQQDLLASAAVHRLAASSPVRTRINRGLARTLRRAADRLDAAAASPSQVGSALPGSGC